ncbi:MULTISPECIES: transposase [Niastella]|uniref:Transposase n=1 Tax=Niastella soli TaxID=2821487 RepID=A0ABS3Z144_9BACT|nr:transposase [Niastella soli]MBO9203886.1 transposase [Niastella soli]
MTSRRRFTEEQKIAILDQAMKKGITAVLREHSLSYSVFARWKQQLIKEEPSNQSYSKTRSELKHLNEENIRLKKIIANLALELNKKEEELKRMNSKR